MDEQPLATIYGAHWCPDCRRCKTFFGEYGVPYEWVDILDHPEVTEGLLVKTGGKRVLPTIVFDNGEVLLRPTNIELARKLSLDISVNRTFWPLIIVGSGPAGLTAAIFTAQNAMETLIIEREAVGGNAHASGYLDNIPGFSKPITGFDFSERLREQAEFFGVEILQSTDVVEIRSHDNYHTVVTADGLEFNANVVIIATGSRYRRLNLADEEKFIGNGIHYCASCDGPFYKGQHIAVLGGGNTAAEAALDLAAIADRITILARGEKLTANSLYQDKISEQENISVLLNSTVTGLSGRNRLRKLLYHDDQKGTDEELRVSGAFVFIGLEPNTEFLEGTDILLDRWGFVRTGLDLLQARGSTLNFEERFPLSFETSVPGIFAVGDVREGSVKQVATAAGEGAAAAMLARGFVKGSGHKG